MTFKFMPKEIAIHDGREVTILVVGGDGGDYLVDAGGNDVFYCEEWELKKL